jgi:hypothetical protein
MLKKKGLIKDAFIRMFMTWRHVPGFNVHNEARIKKDVEKGIDNLAHILSSICYKLPHSSYSKATAKLSMLFVDIAKVEG